eukprot:264904-Pelagomonas_calceolata.AAC.1
MDPHAPKGQKVAMDSSFENPQLARGRGRGSGTRKQASAPSRGRGRGRGAHTCGHAELLQGGLGHRGDHRGEGRDHGHGLRGCMQL